MKLITAVFALVVGLSSCSARRTVYITNKTGKSITLVVDSFYMDSYPAFTDSLNDLRIEGKKCLIMAKDGSKTAVDMPGKTNVSHISFNVEELWVNIK